MNKQEEGRLLAYVKQELSFDRSGHGFSHAKRVAHLAERIAEKEGANTRVAFYAGYLHDTIDHKLFSDLALQIRKAKTFLSEVSFNELEKTEVIAIMETISWNKGQEKELPSPTAECVRDADRLEAIGAIGLIRTIEYGTSKGRPFYEESNIKRENGKISFSTPSETTLSHFYEKLILLERHMCTATGKELARRRSSFLRSFLSEFYSELEESD